MPEATWGPWLSRPCLSVHSLSSPHWDHLGGGHLPPLSQHPPVWYQDLPLQSSGGQWRLFQLLQVRRTCLRGFPGGSVVKNLPAMQETQVWSMGWEDPLKKEMTTHSSILVWKILWTEAWWAAVHGVSKSWTWVSDCITTITWSRSSFTGKSKQDSEGTLLLVHTAHLLRCLSCSGLWLVHLTSFPPKRRDTVKRCVHRACCPYGACIHVKLKLISFFLMKS